MVNLSVILPTFNEGQNIVALIERLEVSLAKVGYEIIVVDDDSPDGTAAVVGEYASTHPAVRVLKRVNKRGLTSAIQDGIDSSGGRAVAWMDCDLSMPPESIVDLYGALDSCDIAVGSRYVEGGSDERSDVPVHRVFSRILNGFLRMLLGGEVTDYTSGFVCARREVVEQIRLVGDYGEYCIDLLHRARKQGFKVAEVAYSNAARASGESKTAMGVLGLLRRGWRYVAAGMRLRLEYGG